jgi:hypothetical protein
MNGMMLRRIALGFAVTPPLPAALWAVSLWRDHGSPGVAALGGTFLNVLPDAYLMMAVIGVPVFLLAGRMGGWIAHLVMGVLAVWFVELLYLTLMSLSDGGLPFSDLPSVFAVVAADAASHWPGSVLAPALFGAVAGWIFWAATRTRPVPFQGRFS